ncbi:competence type IV pilus assembly protein ComGB [Vagococcus elongatus]
MSKKFQLTVVVLLADLLKNGFTFQESLRFMALIYPKEADLLVQMEQFFLGGHTIYLGFRQLGFSDKYVAQINLGEKHGDLVSTFSRVAGQMKDHERQKQSLYKILTYPLILVCFLFSMIMGMNWFLLPQMPEMTSADNFGIWLIQHTPLLTLSVMVILCLASMFVKVLLKKHSQIKKLTFYMHVPLVNVFLQYYYTSFFAYEWGKLLNQGIELRQVLMIMAEEGNTLFMQEIGEVLQKKLESGELIVTQISQWKFFLPGFSKIIMQGEAKGKLGEELMIYGTKIWEDLLEKVEKGTQWLQPIIFLVIALLIIAVYSALLLPIYQSMEGLI